MATSKSEFNYSPRVVELLGRLEAFIEKEIVPLEESYAQHSLSNDKWKVWQPIEDLKQKAKAQRLWNLFLPLESDPERKYGAGLTNSEYAPLAELMGRYSWCAEAFNCSAPDTGNMEVLVKYGTPEQKKEWLMPLLEGRIRSCFGMTEPEVASSDATNIQSSIKRQGDYYVINGRKWWTSGACDPRCKLCVFMGCTNPSAPKHQRQSMILVPMDAPGVRVIRPLSVYGYYDAPHGHAEVEFTNVKVPVGNLLLGEGRGFEIAQGRLGPGRIHHCMRLIGMAERAVELMIKRTTSRVAFGKPLVAQASILQDIARCRCEIDQARLLTLHAADVMDRCGNKVARGLISQIKIVAPSMACTVIDRAIQCHGGAGVCQDFVLAHMWVAARSIRLADGPDEVHMRLLGRLEVLQHQRKAKL